jgi:hypothetical protein
VESRGFLFTDKRKVPPLGLKPSVGTTEFQRDEKYKIIR